MIFVVAIAVFFIATGCCTALPPKSTDIVQVYILAGQSNMEGQGVVDMDHPKYYNGGKGNLNAVMAADPDRYKHLKDAKGNWTVRDDVFVRFRNKQGVMAGGLTIGFTGYGSGKSRHHIGPELQIGHQLGDAIDGPVLLIKTAWGGKSLYKDFRPPSAGGEVGEYYTKMHAEVKEVLENIEKEFSFKIRGFKKYKSEIEKFPNPRSILSIENLAIYRGIQSGMKKAEAFKSIRDIKDNL